MKEEPSEGIQYPLPEAFVTTELDRQYRLPHCRLEFSRLFNPAAVMALLPDDERIIDQIPVYTGMLYPPQFGSQIYLTHDLTRQYNVIFTGTEQGLLPIVRHLGYKNTFIMAIKPEFLTEDETALPEMLHLMVMEVADRQDIQGNFFRSAVREAREKKASNMYSRLLNIALGIQGQNPVQISPDLSEEDFRIFQKLPQVGEVLKLVEERAILYLTEQTIENHGLRHCFQTPESWEKYTEKYLAAIACSFDNRLFLSGTGKLEQWIRSEQKEKTGFLKEYITVMRTSLPEE